MFEPLLSAFSPVWALTNTVVRQLSRGRSKRLSCPVISIGNIVAGGVGKTELVAAIAERLKAKGLKVVVASRGYGSSWEEKGGIAQDSDTATSLSFPDESLVLLRKIPGIAVAVGANRYEVLQKYWEELNPDVVLLDDGLQHFKLSRNLDIIVHDFSVRWPILRDWPALFRKVAVRVSLSDVPTVWKNQNLTWVKARYKLLEKVSANGKSSPLPEKALVFCGLGNPQRFKSSLEKAGVQVLDMLTFQDHAQYSNQDIKKIVEWYRARTQKHGTDISLLTSLKDFVKLEKFIESTGGVAGFEPHWVKIKMEFLENENALWSAIDQTLSGGKPR